MMRLPDVDAMAPRMVGIDEHRFRSVRWFKEPGTQAWKRYEPWMTTIVDLDTGQVFGVVDGRDSKGVGEWLMARPLDWRLGVQVVAIDPSAAFRKALPDVAATQRGGRGSFPSGGPWQQHAQRSATAPDPGDEGPARQGRRPDLGESDAPADRRGGTLGPGPEPAADRLRPRRPHREAGGRLAGQGTTAAAAAHRLPRQCRGGQTETDRFWCTVNKWWNEVEAMIINGATTGKVEAGNTAIKNIKRRARGYRNPDNYKSIILMSSAAKTAA